VRHNKREQYARCARRTIGSEGAAAPVYPQNRAYGSVHGSSRKLYPQIHVEPVRELLVAAYVLSHDSREPARRV